MERFSFIFTVCFVLLGPIKIIPAFARLTLDTEPSFKRRLAVIGTLGASAICLFVALAGRGLVNRYQLSLQALQIGGGLVLLLSALNVIFPRVEPQMHPMATRTPLLIAISPLATPIIVTPAGIAAILIFIMNDFRYPNMDQTLALVLSIILALDFLVMFFNAKIMRIPGLLPTFQVIGAVLVFIQVALAIETMLQALRTLGVVRS